MSDKTVKETAYAAFVVLVLLSASSIMPSKISDQKEEKARQTYEDMLKKYPVPDGAIELKLKWSFPKESEAEKGIFLNGPRCLAMDSKNCVYITDEREHRIAKFDYKGAFIKYLCRRGQGPGDLSVPLFLHIDKDDVLIVGETGNMRFQLLDAEGTYFSSIKMYKGFVSWTTGENEEIYTIPVNWPEGSNFIEVINREGDLIRGFGEPLKFKYSSTIYNMAEIARSKDGKLYIAFRYMDIIRKYDGQGNLLNEFHPENKHYKENEKYNIENQKRIQNKERASFKEVFCSIKLLEDHYFVLHNYPRIEISEYDSNGKLISFLWAKKDYDCLIQSFEIRKIDNKIFFFILQNHPEPMIEVYSPI